MPCPQPSRQPSNTCGFRRWAVSNPAKDKGKETTGKSRTTAVDGALEATFVRKQT
jgi:hypothetical protein